MADKQKNILLFPAGTEIANEIRRSLHNHKHYKLFAASSVSPSHADFLYPEVDHLPFFSDPFFESDLNKLIADRRIDYIFPCHDDALVALAEMKDRLAAKVICQAEGVSKVVRFKAATYRKLKGRDFVPVVFDWDRPEEMKFPVFAKPDRGQGSKGIRKLVNLEELVGFKGDNPDHADYVCCEYLPGAEYTIDCLSDASGLLFAGGRSRTATVNGITTLSMGVENPEFQRIAEELQDVFGFRGLWFYQLKEAADGKLKLLEIGGRVSGNMGYYRMRGVNFTELALLIEEGIPVSVLANDFNHRLSRSLVAVYDSDIEYDRLYIDFDDTLFFEERINTDLVKLLYQAKDAGKEVILITRNDDGTLHPKLERFGLQHFFDDIHQLDRKQPKSDFIKAGSVFIDDAFSERREVKANVERCHVFGIDNFELLFRNG